MKKFILFVLFSATCYLAGSATSSPTTVVKTFCEKITALGNGKSSAQLGAIQKMMCEKPAFRISDDMVLLLARRNGTQQQTSYLPASFIIMLQKEADKGVAIVASNVKEIPKNDIAEYKSGYDYVSCDLALSSGDGQVSHDLFIIKNNQIVSMQRYNMKTDSHGRRRINIDWSGIDEDKRGIGVAYEYSKKYPYGGSVYYTIPYGLISLDGGKAANDLSYSTQKVEFTDVLNYSIEKTIYRPQFYFTLTAAFFMKYFSVGCGYGMLNLKTEETSKSASATWDPETGTFSSTRSAGSAVSEGQTQWHIVRPNVRAFIPCSEVFSITASVSYNIVLHHKKMNDLSFGLGVHFYTNF